MRLFGIALQFFGGLCVLVGVIVGVWFHIAVSTMASGVGDSLDVSMHLFYMLFYIVPAFFGLMLFLIGSAVKTASC